MECEQRTKLDNREFWEHFHQKVAQQRIPVSGVLALTYRCNLRCVHCYLGEDRTRPQQKLEELSTAQWHRIIDEITEAGCLSLVITGGEPLLRRDFAEIYSHAKTNGILVTIFTNGTLMTDELLKLFQKFPPRAVDISLYGATSMTYETVTGIKGSYERCMQGIRKLLAHRIHMSLKTVLMTHNRHEFYEIERIAEEFGVNFRFDPEIVPCLNGENAPVDLRVAPEEAIEKEFSNTKRRQSWERFSKQRQGYRVADDALYQCGSGRTGFYIDPYGNLQPCLMVNSIQYKLSGGSFLTGWNETLSQIRSKKAPKSFRCHQCEKFVLCAYCPPLAELETGAEDIPPDYLCRLGQYRFNAITNSTRRRSHEI